VASRVVLSSIELVFIEIIQPLDFVCVAYVACENVSSLLRKTIISTVS
jgi:hypothetical protein